MRNLPLAEAQRQLDEALAPSFDYGKSDLDADALHAEAVAEMERLEREEDVRLGENNKR